MYKVAICDDDINYIEYMEKSLFKAGFFQSDIDIMKYQSGDAFLLDLEQGLDIDMLILDIHMEGTDGNKVAVELRKKYSNIILIYCSGVCQPSPDSFKVSPFRFLLKEFSDEKMVSELKEIVDYVKSRKGNPIVIGYCGYDQYVLDSDEIAYISIARRGCEIHLADEIRQNGRTILSKEKLSELYDMLKDYNFVYAHNSYIVNIKYVRSRTRDEILMVTGDILTVSRSKTKELKEKMTIFLLNKYKKKE